MFESWNKRRQRQSGTFGALSPNRSWIDNVRRVPATPGAEHRVGTSPQQALAVPAQVANGPTDEGTNKDRKEPDQQRIRHTRET